ncbi:MAG: amino acid ABC transporter permease, partial [Bosea sp. (in: a-proteobacteria)]
MKTISLPLSEAPVPSQAWSPPLLAPLRRLAWLLFGSPLNAILTLVFSVMLAIAVPPMLRWFVFDAVLFNPDPAACRAASGACWSFIYAKSGQLLFGIYPVDERWRPALVCV